jgi:hypothetical protein
MAVYARQQISPAGLDQVHPVDVDAGVNIDIIAIHGLNTRFPDTWAWRDPDNPKKQVNWLGDPKMLPSIVGRARIFTCDWPADMFQKSIPTTLEKRSIFGSARSTHKATKVGARCTLRPAHVPIMRLAS